LFQPHCLHLYVQFVPPSLFNRYRSLSDVLSSNLLISPSVSLGSLLSSYNSTLLDKYAPVITKFCKRSTKSNPWFSCTLRVFRSTVHRAENIYKRTHSAPSFSSFKSLRNSSSHPKSSITLTSSLLPLIILAVSGKLSINYSIGNRHIPYLSPLHLRFSQTVLLLSLQKKIHKLHLSLAAISTVLSPRLPSGFTTSNTSVIFLPACMRIRNIKDTS